MSAVRRYLLVLDMDLLAFDDRFDEQPLNYLLACQATQPGEVFVLSLVGADGPPRSSLEFLGQGVFTTPLTMPTLVRQADPELAAQGRQETYARDRMLRAVQHLRVLGYQADGAISHDPLLRAMRVELRRCPFDQVIVATVRQTRSRLARGLHCDPVHRLHRRLGDRVVIFPLPVHRAAALEEEGRPSPGKHGEAQDEHPHQANA